MERMLRDWKTILYFVGPAFVIFLVFVPTPLGFTLGLSFFEWNLIDKIKFVGLDNFRFLFVDDYVFWKAFGNTFIFLGVSMVLQLPLAFLFAVLLRKDFSGKRAIRNIIFLPVTFSGVAVSLMWYFIYHPKVGLLNSALKMIGLGDLARPWLGSASTALIAVTVSVAWQWVGYHMVIYLAGISTIPRELFEAAEIDGCSEPQMVRHIIMPLLLPMMEVSTVLITTSSLKSFDSIFVMTYGGPGHATEVLASHMYMKAFAQMRFGYGSTIATLLVVLCIVSTLLLNRAFRAGIRKTEE
jgi:raffinose/stachyose/melibiose transport system permease protein